MLIAAFIYDELNYDKQPANAEDIYRVELNVENKDFYSGVDGAVGQGIKDAFPEVLASTRLSRWGNVFLKYDEKQFKEPVIGVVDSNFLSMFSIPLAKGDQQKALAEPYSIVLSEAVATKYFGTENPIGKLLQFNSNTENPLKVTGILGKPTGSLHFDFDIYISRVPSTRPPTWSNVGQYTYIKLKPKANPKTLEAQFPQLVAKYIVPEIQQDMGVTLAEAQKSINTFKFYLKPLTSIHLYSENKDELQANGSIKYVYIFSALAIFILLLACVNFTNLSTAVSSKRSKEVGIRKVMGSGKNQLMGQFLSESVLLSFFSYLLALAVIYFLLPYFNNLAGKHINFAFFVAPLSLAISIPLVVLIGMLAGIYPSFFLASFNIISVLKGSSPAKPQSSRSIRSSLVVFQFFISTALIIATLVVYQQLNYMQNKKLGFATEQALIINDTYFIGTNQSAFKEQLLKDTRVTGVTISRDVPVSIAPGDGTQAYGKEKQSSEKMPEIHINKYHVDYDYIPTLGMEVVLGRNLSKEFPSDSFAVVINETAVSEFGFAKNDVIGKHIITSGQHEYTVVGVVKDFHYTSIKQKIAPLVMMLGGNSGGMIVKVKTASMDAFLADVKKQWQSYNPKGPFAYSFIQDRYASLYGSEKKTGQIFTLFACISILIASMGLFGLSAFAIAQRTKEIGVRKVLGASVSQVVLTLSKEFLLLVLIAFIIAIPVTWFAMHKWLQEFAYRINIGWITFLLAGAIALFIAVVTVSFQAIRAAVANPVKSLRPQ